MCAEIFRTKAEGINGNWKVYGKRWRPKSEETSRNYKALVKIPRPKFKGKSSQSMAVLAEC